MRRSISTEIAAMEMACAILKEKIITLKKEQAEEIEEDEWVEITGGVKHTIGRKAKILRATKLCYWLLDGKLIYRRLKSNTTKITYYNYSDDDNSDDDTVCILNADEPHTRRPFVKEEFVKEEFVKEEK